GDGLVAGYAADAGDDGHERRERHQAFDRFLESADDTRGDEGGDHIERQPRPAVAHRFPHRGEHVFAFAQTAAHEHLVLAALADVVDYRVHGHPTHQTAARIDHRRGHEVVTLEGLCRVLR